MRSLSVVTLLIGLVAFAASQDVTAVWKQPQDNTCASWGDPHIWTWDGQLYSTQYSGYFHLAVSPRINIQAKFGVGCGGRDVTCVYGFKVYLINDAGEYHSFELNADYLNTGSIDDGFRQPFRSYGFAYSTKIDGQDAHMVPDVNNGDNKLVDSNSYQSVGLNGGGQVAYFVDNHIYSVKFVFNDIVIQFLPWTLSITPLNPSGSAQNELWNNVCGLCGTYTGSKYDDYFTRQQYTYTLDSDPSSFAYSWAVTDADTVRGYFSCSGGPEPTPKPTNPPSPPTSAPTPGPTRPSTGSPTVPPSDAPTPGPTNPPTQPPTAAPTNPPTQPPTARPTNPPTQPPTNPPSGSPTQAPTPYQTTGFVTSTTGQVSTTGSSTGGGNQTTNITVIVNSYNGTQQFTDANTTCCEDAHVCQGDPLYDSCMMDVLKTNQTSLAIASTGAIVLAGCAKTNITDTSCIQGSLFACPGACNGAGSCVLGKCQCRKGYEVDKDSGSCISAGLTQAQIIAVGISAGIVAAIVIGGIVFLVLAGFGAKKGYDYYHMKDNKMANVNSNPLYNEKKTGGVSPLYADKA